MGSPRRKAEKYWRVVMPCLTVLQKAFNASQPACRHSPIRSEQTGLVGFLVGRPCQYCRRKKGTYGSGSGPGEIVRKLTQRSERKEG